MLNKFFGFLFLLLLLNGCAGYYKIPTDNNGQPMLNDKVNYTFTEVPSDADFRKIDTTAFYVQIFEGRYYNADEKKDPELIIFHKNGYFQQTTVSKFEVMQDIPKNSVYYGGKYRIIDNLIEFERFYPAQGGKTNLFSRNIRQAYLIDDRIVFDDGLSLLSMFEKRNSPN